MTTPTCENCIFSEIREDADRLLTCTNARVLEWHRSRMGSRFVPAASYEQSFGSLCGKDRVLFSPKEQPAHRSHLRLSLYPDLLTIRQSQKDLHLTDKQILSLCAALDEVDAHLEIPASGPVKILSLKVIS